MIVGLCGAAGSGKDTAAEALVKHQHFYPVSFTTPIKHVLNGLFQWRQANWEDREWKDTANEQAYGLTPREVAQRLGTDWGRNLIHKDIWIDMAIQEALQDHELYGHDHVFTDVRFPNEAKAIRDAGGILLYITCKDLETGTKSFDHECESWQEWLWLYADAELSVDFGAIDALQEATLNVVANYHAGLVPAFKPSGDTLAQLNEIAEKVESRIT